MSIGMHTGLGGAGGAAGPPGGVEVRAMMPSAIVVGAGLVGLCCARALQRDGHAVTIVDREGPCAGASFGNAAHIATASVIPQATPGILRQTARLLRDPEGPLIARPAYVARRLPWFLRFIAQGQAARMQAGGQAMAAMMAQAWDAWRPVLADAGASDLARTSGAMHVFGSAAARRAADGAYAMRRALGVDCIDLDLAEARAREPALTDRVAAAVWVPSMGYVADTRALARRLADRIVADGGVVKRGAVTALGERGVRIDDLWVRADRIVLAAGAWSDPLGRSVGSEVPVVSERGYHRMLPPGSSPLRTPVLLVDRKVAVTPMDEGIRMASLAEFTEPDAAPDHDRAAPVFRGLERLVAGLDAPPASVWVGPRPSTPDSRPIIGHAPAAPRVLLAYGHGHLGLTLAALTGQAVADLAAGRPPAIDPRAVSPVRRERLR